MIIVMAVILMAAGTVYLTFAADPMKTRDANEMMMPRGMMGQPMAGRQIPMMCPMHMMMAEQFMEKDIVATSDGGAIIMVDNKLLKYDKELNLVKEVDLKIDTKAMQEKLSQMMKECAEKCQMAKPPEKGGSM